MKWCGERFNWISISFGIFALWRGMALSTRAAEAERVAQPSLSQQILKLEAELGAKLFDRLSRSARLTEFGRAFLPNAERILGEISEAKTEILEMSGKDKGEVLVGAIAHGRA